MCKIALILSYINQQASEASTVFPFVFLTISLLFNKKIFSTEVYPCESVKTFKKCSSKLCIFGIIQIFSIKFMLFVTRHIKTQKFQQKRSLTSITKLLH